MAISGEKQMRPSSSSSSSSAMQQLLGTTSPIAGASSTNPRSTPYPRGTATDDDNSVNGILNEARSAAAKKYMPTSLDGRTQQLIQEALNASIHRDLKVRTTKEVLAMARQVLPHTGTSDQLVDLPRSSPRGSPRGSTSSMSTLQPVGERRSQYLSPPTNGGASDPSRILSPTESEVDEFERSIQDLETRLSNPSLPRETWLNKVDGISQPLQILKHDDSPPNDSQTLTKPTTTSSMFAWLGLGGLLGTDQPQSENQLSKPAMHNTGEPAFSPLTCGSMTSAEVDHIDEREKALIIPNLQAVTSAPHPSLPNKVDKLEIDPRMPAWISAQSATFAEDERIHEKTHEDNGESFYSLGTSRTVIVHEIVRGNWTWCTAWSPDGTRLAIGTENHHLAVVDANSSTVWRVRHDKKITKPMKKGTTHSIRTIAWGNHFIAIGGTGNAVSILAPIEPYPIIHAIPDTGFVGSLDWRVDSAILAIGTRDDKCMVVDVKAAEAGGPPGTARSIASTVLHTIKRRDWVNQVKFSPGGFVLAIGDKRGTVTICSYVPRPKTTPHIKQIGEVRLADSVLSLEWSPDGKMLYAGGEDYAITVIDTTSWQPVIKVERDRWVHFIASSNRGSHIAVGGGSSRVSILERHNKWKLAMNIDLKGLVPLSARWHPRDQYIALTGQDDSVIAIETTNARHVLGHYLKSISPIIDVIFAPDGRMLAVANETGVVTFYTSSGSTFVTMYEMVLAYGSSQSMFWSPSGSFVVIGCHDTLVIIAKSNPKQQQENGRMIPPRTSGFGVRKVVRDLGNLIIASVSMHRESRYIALSGTKTRILDALNNFRCVREWDQDKILANAWSASGNLLATIGRCQQLIIYDTSNDDVGRWRVIFKLQAKEAGLALSWAPTVVDGLEYLAYGGEDKSISIIEIRTLEKTWETVLQVPRNGVIHDLDWSRSGLLAAAIGDGTVTIIDLAYLQSGWAVNEMDYDWQRQGVTCFTEIRRSQGANSMRNVRWIPSLDEHDCLLAVGGTDGALEVVDLTERQRCKGFWGNNINNHNNNSAAG